MICKKLIINKLLKTLNNLISSPSHTPSFHKCKKSIKISIDNLNRIIQSRNDDNFNQSSNRSSSHQKSRHNSSRSSSKGSKCEKYKSKFTVAVPYYNRTPSFTRRTKSSIVNFSVYKSLQCEPPSNLNCHDKQEKIHKVKPDIVQSMMKMLQSRNSKLTAPRRDIANKLFGLLNSSNKIKVGLDSEPSILSIKKCSLNTAKKKADNLIKRNISAITLNGKLFI